MIYLSTKLWILHSWSHQNYKQRKYSHPLNIFILYSKRNTLTWLTCSSKVCCHTFPDPKLTYALVTLTLHIRASTMFLIQMWEIERHEVEVTYSGRVFIPSVCHLIQSCIKMGCLESSSWQNRPVWSKASAFSGFDSSFTFHWTP
jgi:hypothetical protein